MRSRFGIQLSPLTHQPAVGRLSCFNTCDRYSRDRAERDGFLGDEVRHRMIRAPKGFHFSRNSNG